jgi:hypothetical protein
MKKINLTLLAALLVAQFSFAQNQQNWETTEQAIAPNDNANLGTKNRRSVNIVTDNIKRATFDSLGNFSLTKLAGSGYRLVYVDDKGNLSISQGVPGGGGGEPNQIPWYEGGNMVGNPYINTIGTCNDRDFVLKSNNVTLINLKQNNSYIGFGANNNNPTSHFDFTDGIEHISLKQDIFGDFAEIASTKQLGLNFGTNGQSGNSFVIRENGNIKFTIFGTNAISNTNFNINGNTSISQDLNVNNTITGGSLRIGTPTNNFKISVYSGSSGGDCYIAMPATPTTKAFSVQNPNWQANESFVVYGSGKTHIGYGRPLVGGAAANASLTVDGMILAKDIRVAISQATHWADYVFDKNYKLMPLKEVETFVKANKHLPELPTEAEVINDGMDVTQINVLLLKKVEELTLYMIELQKESEEQKLEIEKLKNTK